LNLFVITTQVDRKEREFRGTATTFLLKICIPHGNSRLQNAKKYLVIRSKWHMTKVMNLASQIREFQALSAVGNFPLLQTILCTSIRERQLLSKNGKACLKGLATDLGDRLRIDYNESQVSAIAAAVGQQDLAAAAHQLALVQGPPGESEIISEIFMRQDHICHMRSYILITLCYCDCLPGLQLSWYCSMYL
jgi:hypothetical protein